MAELDSVRGCFERGYFEWRRKRMEGKKSKEAARTKKPYVKPTVTKLTDEQAKLKLLGHAIMGDQGAKDLLEEMFRETASRDSSSKRKSA